MQGCGTTCVIDILLSSSSLYPDPAAQTIQIDISATTSLTMSLIHSPRGTRTGTLTSSSWYWVRWLNGVVSVGTGSTVGGGTSIVSFTDPAASTVAYAALASTGAALTYVVNVPGSLRPI